MDTIYTYKNLNINKGIVSYELLSREICEKLKLDIQQKISETILLTIKDTDIQIFNPIQKDNYFIKELKWWLKNPAINSCILINVEDVEKQIEIQFVNYITYPLMSNKVISFDSVKKIINVIDANLPQFIYKNKPKTIFIWDEKNNIKEPCKQSYFNNKLKEFISPDISKLNLSIYPHFIEETPYIPDNEFISFYLYAENEKNLYDKYDIEEYEDIFIKEFLKRIKEYDYDNMYITNKKDDEYIVIIKYGEKIIVKTFLYKDLLNVFVNK